VALKGAWARHTARAVSGQVVFEISPGIFPDLWFKEIEFGAFAETAIAERIFGAFVAE
jgi:hypothetical protein